MLGKASTAILAVTAIVCCLAVMVNGLDLNNITDEQIDKLNKKLSEAKCNVTTNKAEEAIIASNCITNETGNKVQIPVEIRERMEAFKKLGLNQTQWKAVETCIYNAYKWDQIWTQDGAKEFIERNITYANDATRAEFGQRIDICLALNKDNITASTECGQKAFQEVCLNITEADDFTN